jgi:hypothetical protein
MSEFSVVSHFKFLPSRGVEFQKSVNREGRKTWIVPWKSGDSAPRRRRIRVWASAPMAPLGLNAIVDSDEKRGPKGPLFHGARNVCEAGGIDVVSRDVALTVSN